MVTRDHSASRQIYTGRTPILSSLILMFLTFAFAILPGPAYGQPFFEYELHVQAETSLDIGPVNVLGKIVNTGTATLDLTPQGISQIGVPNIVVICDAACVPNQISGMTLEPGDSISFTWLTGTIEEDLSDRAGSLLSSHVALVPLGSDWQWNAGGNIPEILVSTTFVNGPANTALPFNIRVHYCPNVN